MILMYTWLAIIIWNDKSIILFLNFYKPQSILLIYNKKHYYLFTRKFVIIHHYFLLTDRYNYNKQES